MAEHSLFQQWEVDQELWTVNNPLQVEVVAGSKQRQVACISVLKRHPVHVVAEGIVWRLL